MNKNFDLPSMIPFREEFTGTFTSIGKWYELEVCIRSGLEETESNGIADFLCSQRTFELIRANEHVHDSVELGCRIRCIGCRELSGANKTERGSGRMDLGVIPPKKYV